MIVYKLINWYFYGWEDFDRSHFKDTRNIYSDAKFGAFFFVSVFCNVYQRAIIGLLQKANIYCCGSSLRTCLQVLSSCEGTLLFHRMDGGYVWPWWLLGDCCRAPCNCIYTASFCLHLNYQVYISMNIKQIQVTYNINK